MVSPLLRRESLEQNEPLSINQLFSQHTQKLCKVLKLEVLLGDACQRRAARDKRIRSVGDLFDFGVGKDVRPLFWVIYISILAQGFDEDCTKRTKRTSVVLYIPHRGPCDLLREVLVRVQLVVQRRMLSRGLDTIRVNLLRRIVISVLLSYTKFVRRRGRHCCQCRGHCALCVSQSRWAMGYR